MIEFVIVKMKCFEINKLLRAKQEKNKKEESLFATLS